MTHLTGKIALVTGGARGIGAATARKLAAHGATVIVTYSKSGEAAEKLAKELGGKSKAILADAGKPETMPALVKQVIKEFGAIDILVNNAGVFGGGIVGELDYAEYERTFAINVSSVIALTNAAVPHMKAGGRIINISSCLGERAIFPGLSIYNASKFAVLGFTRSWAQDLGSKNITVNAVLPGPIDTEMNPADAPGAADQDRAIPMGRHGKPEEVAAAVAFLASPEASFINGVSLNVDGGLNA